MSGGSSGHVLNGTFASAALNDDTGLSITVTTGGTFQDVKGTPLAAGVQSADASITVSAADGTFAIPAGKLGKYRFSATGVLLPTASKTVQLRAALAGAVAAGAAQRIVGAATPLETPFAMSGIINVTAAGSVSLQVTSTSNADVVNFKRLQITLEYLEAA